MLKSKDFQLSHLAVRTYVCNAMDKPLAQRGISVHLPTPYKSCRYPSSRITKMTRLAKGAKSHQSFTPAVKICILYFHARAPAAAV